MSAMSIEQTKAYDAKLIGQAGNNNGQLTISNDGLTNAWRERVLFKSSIARSFSYEWDEIVGMRQVGKRTLEVAFTKGRKYEYRFKTSDEAAEASKAAAWWHATHLTLSAAKGAVASL